MIHTSSTSPERSSCSTSFRTSCSDLSHWRKRLGGKLELLLAESLRVAHESGALRTKDLARVTVDTTVQPKDITFPTDAKLLHAAIKGLTRLARKRGVRLRQSYAQSSSQHNWSAAAERIWSFQSSDRKMIADHQSSTSLT